MTTRYRVVLDFGLQHQTVYVRADNSVGARNKAEALAPGDCDAVAWTIPKDQDGPLDGDGSLLGSHGARDVAPDIWTY